MQNTLLTTMSETMYRMTMAYKYGGDIFEYFYDKGQNEIEFDLILEDEAIPFIPVMLNRMLHIPINIYSTDDKEYVIKAAVSGKEMLEVRPISELKYQTDRRIVISYCKWNWTLFVKIEKLNYWHIPLGELVQYTLYKRVVFEETVGFLKEKKVNCLFSKFPQANRITKPSNLEKWISNNGIYGVIAEGEEYGLNIGELFLDSAVEAEIIDGIQRCADKHTEGVNFINGSRVTTDIPLKTKKRIWVFGSSVVAGYLADDEHTICSELQRKLNKHFGEKNEYAVVNASNYSSHAVENIVPYIKSLQIEEGDICIFHMEFPKLLMEKRSDIVDMSPYFNRPHDYGEIFTDMNHMNGRGYCVQGDILFNILLEKELFDKDVTNKKEIQVPVNDTGLLSLQENYELKQYLEGLVNYRKKIGSIVMNCNPFTLGHRYLIQSSAEKVDTLYIFVVQEDKSFFAFKDRFELVKKGTADLKNVVVVPSGKFIISQRTFAAYSNKANLQDKVVDSSLDVEIFAKNIAPYFGINIRFAGEEPLDNVTKQYNENMARVLPKYGIEFEVISRKESGGEVISASRVRKYLQNKEFEKIKEIVPQTTYDYLMENFGRV